MLWIMADNFPTNTTTKLPCIRISSGWWSEYNFPTKRSNYHIIFYSVHNMSSCVLLCEISADHARFAPKLTRILLRKLWTNPNGLQWVYFYKCVTTKINTMPVLNLYKLSDDAAHQSIYVYRAVIVIREKNIICILCYLKIQIKYFGNNKWLLVTIYESFNIF